MMGSSGIRTMFVRAEKGRSRVQADGAYAIQALQTARGTKEEGAGSQGAKVRRRNRESYLTGGYHALLSMKVWNLREHPPSLLRWLLIWFCALPVDRNCGVLLVYYLKTGRAFWRVRRKRKRQSWTGELFQSTSAFPLHFPVFLKHIGDFMFLFACSPVANVIKTKRW